jgi:hypothetical protein
VFSAYFKSKPNFYRVLVDFYPRIAIIGTLDTPIAGGAEYTFSVDYKLLLADAGSFIPVNWHDEFTHLGETLTYKLVKEQ